MRIDPAPGSEITPDTKIVADLEYTIEQFRVGGFQAGATAMSVRPLMGFTLKPSEGAEAVRLRAATGRITVAFDPRALWDRQDLRRPFEVFFAIEQFFGTMGETVTAAATPPVEFKPVGR